MKTLLSGLLVILATQAFSAELYCESKKVNMSLVVSGGDRYLQDLYSSNCGVEGEVCFIGKDSEAYKLINTLNFSMYESFDEYEIIGAYFKTGSSDTIALKYKEEGQFSETIIRRCE